jgi:hypothetical protein
VIARNKIVTELVGAQDCQQRKGKGRAREQVAFPGCFASEKRGQDGGDKQCQVDPGSRRSGADDAPHGDQHVLVAVFFVSRQGGGVVEGLETTGQLVKGQVGLLLQIAAKADGFVGGLGHVHGHDVKNARQLGAQTCYNICLSWKTDFDAHSPNYTPVEFFSQVKLARLI